MRRVVEQAVSRLTGFDAPAPLGGEVLETRHPAVDARKLPEKLLLQIRRRNVKPMMEQEISPALRCEAL